MDHNYLMRTKGKKPERYAAHLWDGLDTLCKMYSTNGLAGGRSKKYYEVTADLGNRRICHMCSGVLGRPGGVS